MELKQIAEKSLLSMSDDCDFIYGRTHSISIEGKDLIHFKHSETIPLYEAEKKINAKTFYNLIQACKGLVKNDIIPELTNYINSERLSVYMKETDNYYIIISFGEYQPTLYKIYIEGIFKKVFT